MDTLNVGLIGCGRIARLVHLNILTRLPGTEVVAEDPVGRRRSVGPGITL